MHDHHILFRNDFTGESLLFAEPREIVTAWSTHEVKAAFDALEQAKRQGFRAAGFVAYEAGYALDPAWPPAAYRGAVAPVLRSWVSGFSMGRNRLLPASNC